jgi:hypothetical protein
MCRKVQQRTRKVMEGSLINTHNLAAEFYAVQVSTILEKFSTGGGEQG